MPATERCPDCGFDAAQWTEQDLTTTAAVAGALAAWAADDPAARSSGRGRRPSLDQLVSRVASPAGPGRCDEALHAVQHRLHEIGRRRHERLGGAPTRSGWAEHLHVSGGGVPKQPVDRLDIGWSGPAGDRQADRRHHGRPFQAVSLWSSEVIDQLRDEGHPIAPGLAGENITLRGLEWGELGPGMILEVGSALVEISSYAIPCAKNARWFADGDVGRIRHESHPGSSRLYATVLRPGEVHPGDPLTVEPDPDHPPATNPG